MAERYCETCDFKLGSNPESCPECCEDVAFARGRLAGLEEAALTVEDTDEEWRGSGFMSEPDARGSLRSAAARVRALSQPSKKGDGDNE